MRQFMLATGVVVALAGSAQAVEWEVKTATSALDGKRSASAMLDSDQDLPNSIGVLEKALLVVKCDGGKVQAYVAWPKFVGIRSIRGGYKVDNGPAVMNEGFSSSTDGTATFFYQGNIQKTLTAIASGTRLVVRAEPVNYAAQEATWQLGDARSAITQVAAAC